MRRVADHAVLLSVLALVTVICTGMIYASLPTIRQWCHPLVVPVYLAFSLATGALLLLAIAQVFGRDQTVQVVFAAGGLAVALALKLAYWKSIDAAKRTHTIENATGLGFIGAVRQFELPHTSENYLMKEMGYRVGRKHAAKLRRMVVLSLGGSLIFCLLTLTLPPATGCWITAASPTNREPIPSSLPSLFINDAPLKLAFGGEV